MAGVFFSTSQKTNRNRKVLVCALLQMPDSDMACPVFYCLTGTAEKKIRLSCSDHMP